MKRIRLVTLVLALAASVATAAEDSGPTDWPRTYAGSDGGLLTVYQPQVDAWPGRVKLEAHAAVELQRGEGKASYGAVWISARTRTDQRTGQVALESPELTRLEFPTLGEDERGRVRSALESGLAESSLSVPLPAVLASLSKEETTKERARLSNDPPQIYYSAKPAILVALNGRAALAPVKGTSLSYAVNTNWNLFSDGTDGQWYLLDGESWLVAPSLDGPWTAAETLPDAFSSLPDGEEWKDVRAHVPGKTLGEGDVPRVFVTTKPAELLLTAGPPQMESIPGTQLLYVENSPNDLFLEKSDSTFYVLLGGRWFSATTLDGPWESAAGSLPQDFRKIPPGSPRASVLVSVPGTTMAEEAALQADVPVLATVDREKATLDVVYAGEPKFEPIEGTDLTYAVNTAYSVVDVSGDYYAVSNGVWFESASPTGPWVAAVEVPPAIYTIPPTSPLYPITFVRVYSYTPSAVVVGYTAGYLGTYVWGGTVVFGTGFYYPPYFIPGPVPIYYPYFRTYSAVTWYNPATGAYGRGAAVVGPYGGAGAGWAYNPHTGTYARGARAYGPYGGAGYVAAYNPQTGAWGRAGTVYGPGGRSTWAEGGNPWTGTYARTQQNRSPYAQWGHSTVTRGGVTTQAAHYSNARGSVGGFDRTDGAAGAGYHTATGKSGGVVHGSGGDVYADHNGNVYKHSSSDGWQKYDDGSWQNVQRPTGDDVRERAGESSASGSFAQRWGDGGGLAGRFEGAGQGGGLLGRLQQDRGARQFGRLGGALGGGGFEGSRDRRFGGGFGGGFGRGRR